MAIYHASAKIIQRSTGQSAVASAAYRAGVVLHDDRIGKTFDFTRKERVLHTEIMLPVGVPDIYSQRDYLWNEVERSENRKDAQLAREWTFALPRELSVEQQKSLISDFVKDEFVARGMIADVCLHDTKDNNPHAHVMLTMRSWDEENNNFGKKDRSWNDKELLKNWRKSWAEYCNTQLKIVGIDEQVDHRSHADRGIEQIPQIHLGPNVVAMQSKGISTDRYARYTEIAAANDVITHARATIIKIDDVIAKAKRKPTASQPRLESVGAKQGAAMPTPTPTPTALGLSPRAARPKKPVPAPAKAAKRPVPTPTQRQRTRYDDYCDAVSELDKRMRDAKSKFDNALAAIVEKTWKEKTLQKIGVLVSDAEQERLARSEYNNTRSECEAQLKELQNEYKDEIEKRKKAPELTEERKAEIEFVKQRNADREASERRNSEFRVEIDSVDRAKHLKPKL